jgi:predicted amidophosphoribosyltransferase
MQHIHVTCASCISMLGHPSSCCKPLLQINAACPCCRFMIHSILHVHAAYP